MIAKNLLTLRKKFGYSQEEVADRIGVARQTVAKWENGESTPDIANGNKLAALYDVSLDDLVNYDPQSCNGAEIAPKGKYCFGLASLGQDGEITLPPKAIKTFGLTPGEELAILGDIDQGIAIIPARRFFNALYTKGKEE